MPTMHRLERSREYGEATRAIDVKHNPRFRAANPAKYTMTSTGGWSFRGNRGPPSLPFVAP